MLGLKEGPRVQMKARISLLKSELEDKDCEIARLNALMEDSSLSSLETQVKTLTLDLEVRDKKLLAMCDKVEYIRNYLHQLKTEEQLSIKCGLEALLTELNEDAENNREVRRNVSISLDKEPNEHVIIINHRSQSLPDTALQRQVINFKTATSFNPRNYLHGIPARSIKFDFDALSKLNRVGQSVGSFQKSLNDTWKSVNLESHLQLMDQLDSVLVTLEADHCTLTKVCDHLECFSSSISNFHEVTSSTSASSLSSIHDSLKSALENMENNNLYGPEDNSVVRINVALFYALRSSLSSALSLVESVKTDHYWKKELINNNDLEQFKEVRTNLANVTSSYGHLIKQLSTIISSEASISKSVQDKCNEFEADLPQLTSATASVVSELKSSHFLEADQMCEREMIEALYLKKQQNVQSLMTSLTSSDGEVQHTMVCQQDDDKLLSTFSAQMQTYKEKVGQLERKIFELEANRLNDDIHREKAQESARKLQVLQAQVSQLSVQLSEQIEEKLLLKVEHQRSLEDLQFKINALQAALQAEKDSRVSSKSMWFLPWPLKRKPSRL